MTFTVFLGITIAVTLPATLASVLGWVFAIVFALSALACAAIAGDRLWERNRAVNERDQALAELAELRAGHTPAPGWHDLLPPWDGAFHNELTDAEVDARFADLRRAYNDSDQEL